MLYSVESMLKGASFVLLVLLAARPLTTLGCELACAAPAHPTASSAVACHGTSDDDDGVNLRGAQPGCTHESGPLATLRALPRMLPSGDTRVVTVQNGCSTPWARADLVALTLSPPGPAQPVSPPAFNIVLRI